VALLTYNLGVYTTCQANSAAFLPLSELTSSSTDIINRLQSQNPQDIYPAGTDPTVIAGWKAQRDLLIKYTKQPKVAYGEIAMGAGAGGALSLVKPYSRGTITINSTDPFDIPVLDFGTFRNPLDLEVFVEIVRTWKKLLQASSLQPLNPVIISPADNVTSTEDIGSYIRTNAAATFAHPSGSAPMMRKDLGGVIGPDLLVYGTRKLSIIDASILPIAPATHLTSTMYAVAEKVGHCRDCLLSETCLLTNVRDFRLLISSRHGLSFPLLGEPGASRSLASSEKKLNPLIIGIYKSFLCVSSLRAQLVI
jgi:hypothetical protein